MSLSHPIISHMMLEVITIFISTSLRTEASIKQSQHFTRNMILVRFVFLCNNEENGIFFLWSSVKIRFTSEEDLDKYLSHKTSYEWCSNTSCFKFPSVGISVQFLNVRNNNNCEILAKISTLKFFLLCIVGGRGHKKIKPTQIYQLYTDLKK